MNLDIGLALAVLGGFLGLAGWLSGREKRVSQEAQWRGEVNAKLDVIVGVKNSLEGLQDNVKAHEGRLSAIENSVKSAHHRLDEHISVPSERR